jgi:hypothetical protein
VFDEHEVAQTAFSQANGVQSVVGPPTHLPPPSHFEVLTMIGVLPPVLQAVAAQIVPAA